ncbi:fused DSP-PTPase phosphatase/NAD kinase-like protein [Oceanicella actignis]|uniref:Protein tyrosine/serine phosphatase n=1 Tax=Oceanicella actignis TaxID=1189325 RepID=A0A1M7SCM1_9RHOB|nr:tyrosine-protein phosphatase [Oceanicella actignis]SET25921.1 Protein tyrosine/serine phosphatase [Oceanicella actignis]SHN56267.1 Protein tyrosine/serine phosphatase [Oceanicella actignis]
MTDPNAAPAPKATQQAPGEASPPRRRATQFETPPPRRDPEDPSLPARTRRRLRRANRARARWGAPIETTSRRIHAWLNMLFVDHGALRLIHPNLHRVGRDAWRSAQPLPHHIDRLARQGLRTVITLRGGVIFGSLPLEREACARNDVTLERFVLRSRDLPKVEELLALEELVARVERPVLFHCKSGADRAGFMAALWLILAEGRSVAEARGQLSLRYGHLKIGPTGVLDLFMERAAEAERRGVPFRQWVRTEYDREAMRREFRSSGFGAFLVDRVLGRE